MRPFEKSPFKNEGKPSRLIPLGLLVFFALYALSSLGKPVGSSLFDIDAVGRLPVLHGGRIKPLDSVARSSLLMIHGKQTLAHRGQKKPAMDWLLDVMFDGAKSDLVPLFQIDNPDVLGLMQMQQTKERYFSFSSIRPFLNEIERQSSQASQLKPEQRTRYQTAVVNLANRLFLYHKLQNTLQIVGMKDAALLYQQSHDRIVQAAQAHIKNPSIKPTAEMKELSDYISMYDFLDKIAEFFPIPPSDNPLEENRWMSLGQGLLVSLDKPELVTGLLVYATLGDAYRAGDVVIFNQTVATYRHWLEEKASVLSRHSDKEIMFNRAALFIKALVIYLVVFVLACLSWLYFPAVLNRSAFYLLILAFVVHSAGLILRMVLQGRPPVTNLYSSAIFVGWVSVLLGIVIEKFSRRGLGSAAASFIGFLTLIIAHHLSAQGDTLEMMRAVLDSNFWLATHVVCITIGYSSTFVSGTLAIIYIVRRLFDGMWDLEKAAQLEKMTYGVVCFSALFSFLGTVLGGIWADQSWGRFWGWDPKENGALMIVLWNAFLLHARWGRLVSQRTQIALTVFGNIITALSWFGVNMLGIGLHSYGFMDKAFVWLVIFSVCNLVFMAGAYLPFQKKLSNSQT